MELDKERLAKLLNMTGSDHDAEALAAARKANEFLRQHRKSWRDVLGLKFEDGADHVSTALEWEVRVQGKPVEIISNGAAHHTAKAVADLFPAYDDENGGLLIVLTPTNHH